MNKTFYHMAQVLVSGLYKIIRPIQIVNPENVPTEGPCIVCVNHISLRDPLYVGVHMRHPLQFMAKKELFENKLLKPIVEGLGAFPVARGESDISALRTSLQILKDGGMLGIFPEGTRVKDDAEHKIQSGVALIALKAGVPVCPVYINGPYRLFHKTKVIFGNKLTFEDLPKRIDRAAITVAAGRIEQGIWSLRPAEMTVKS